MEPRAGAQSESRTKLVCLHGEVFVPENFILQYLRGLPMLDLADEGQCPYLYHGRGEWGVRAGFL